MLKRDITFENFEGETVTKPYYFNLNRTELFTLQTDYEGEGGFDKVLERIIETKKVKDMIEIFKKIIHMSYGVKSEDGERFIKNEQVLEEFMQTPAYDALFMELATDDGAAATFIQGIMPKALLESVNMQDVKDVTANALGQQQLGLSGPAKDLGSPQT